MSPRPPAGGGGLPFFGKVLAIVALFSSAVFYGLLERRRTAHWRTDEASLVLKALPEFEARSLEDGGTVGRDLLGRFPGGLLVHFWGTWCAPCVTELPELVSFARSLGGEGPGFLLLAVRDDDGDIGAFLGRAGGGGPLPPNVVVAHDRDGGSLARFGTAKLPETYLFAPDGRHLRKFVGPQAWSSPLLGLRVETALARAAASSAPSATDASSVPDGAPVRPGERMVESH